MVARPVDRRASRGEDEQQRHAAAPRPALLRDALANGAAEVRQRQRERDGHDQADGAFEGQPDEREGRKDHPQRRQRGVPAVSTRAIPIGDPTRHQAERKRRAEKQRQPVHLHRVDADQHHPDRTAGPAEHRRRLTVERRRPRSPGRNGLTNGRRHARHGGQRQHQDVVQHGDEERHGEPRREPRIPGPARAHVDRRRARATGRSAAAGRGIATGDGRVRLASGAR